MTVAAKLSKGAELWLCPSGGTLVLVAELLSVDPPKKTRDTIEVTTHDSGQAMEYLSDGVYDGGEINAQVHYIAATAGDTAMLTAMTTGAKQDWKIVVKNAATTTAITGSGYLTVYGPDGLSVKGKQTAAISLKVTGAATQT